MENEKNNSSNNLQNAEELNQESLAAYNAGDYLRAIGLFTLSGEQGNIASQLNLGGMYYGTGKKLLRIIERQKCGLKRGQDKVTLIVKIT